MRYLIESRDTSEKETVLGAERGEKLCVALDERHRSIPGSCFCVSHQGCSCLSVSRKGKLHNDSGTWLRNVLRKGNTT